MASNIFTGASRYSTDFQSVIDRSVNIASLPLLQMQQNKVKISDESAALKSLDGKLASLETTLTNLANSFGSGSYSISNSDSSTVSARISDGVAEGTYTVKVLDIGSYATASSKSKLTVVTDPATQNISEAESFSLTINGGEAISIEPADNSLKSLVEAINNANAGVRATLVNLSPSGTPEYHLSIQSTTLGSTTISLTGDGDELLDSATGGSQARYIVNGRVEESVSSSRTVTLSTGLTIDLVKESTSTATIQVTRGTGNVKAAIDAFVNSYNGVIDELGKHYGQQNGALSGNSLVFTTNNVLREISSYSTGNSGMSSLASLGILTDKSGKLYVDAAEWDKVKTNVSGLQAFFGKSDSSGFLKAASDRVNGLHAEQSGIVSNAIKITAEQAVSADARITEEQRRIDDLKTDLQKKFYAADALIASLEQQATYFINMFAAMKSNQESING